MQQQCPKRIHDFDGAAGTFYGLRSYTLSRNCAASDTGDLMHPRPGRTVLLSRTHCQPPQAKALVRPRLPTRPYNIAHGCNWPNRPSRLRINSSWLHQVAERSSRKIKMRAICKTKFRISILSPFRTRFDNRKILHSDGCSADHSARRSTASYGPRSFRCS